MLDLNPFNKAIFNKTVNKLVVYGANNGATTIQLEITPDGQLETRYQFNGEEQGRLFFDPSLAEGVFSYIKDLANLTAKNSSGSFILKNQGQTIKIGATLINTNRGELLNLKIAKQTIDIRFLDELGLNPSHLELISAQLFSPGLTIISGPAESGKTTTGLAMLLAANLSNFNVYSLASQNLKPINGINQLKVKNSASEWHKALRVVSQQDADFIYLDEPNLQTCADLLASLSISKGVIINLEASSSWEAVKKLISAGLTAGPVKPRFNLLINQCLVKRLCELCQINYQIDEKIFQDLSNNFDILDQDLIGLELFHAQGCPACNHSGYDGQLGLFEVIKANAEFNALVSQNKTTAKAWLENSLNLSLLEDGFIKALKGLTTIETIKKVL